MLLDTVEVIPANEHALVCHLEAEILKHPQVEMPVEHQHCAGLYARTMFIPAGTVATGAVHRHESFFLVRAGTLIVHTPKGPMQFDAGHMSITRTGDKRAVIAVTDVIVTTFHANPDNETDPEALWNRYTTPPAASQIPGSTLPVLERQP